MKKIILGMLLLVSLFICTACNTQFKSLQADAEDLEKTEVTSYLQKEIEKGKNILYCSTFQLAWNTLCDDIIENDLKLSGSPKIQQMLNERITDSKDLLEKDYLAMAGYGKENIVEEINQNLKEKFGSQAPSVKENLAPRDIISYAFLYKNLEFKKQFERLELKFNNRKISGFGIKKNNKDETYEMAKQVNVLNYNSQKSFIIELISESQTDKIILAKISPEKTLLDTIKKVQQKINNSQAAAFRSDETLKIPKFDFDIHRDYHELTGRNVLNEGFQSYYVDKALQDIKFKLNEKGAILKSEAKMVLKEAAAVKEPRKFVFDAPFLIMLHKKNADMPYFALWNYNTELMVK